MYASILILLINMLLCDMYNAYNENTIKIVTLKHSSRQIFFF